MTTATITTEQAPQLRVYTLLFTAEGRKGRFAVSYEVVAQDAEEAARLAKADFAARDERVLEIDRAESFPVGNPLTPKGVLMRVGCRYFAETA